MQRWNKSHLYEIAKNLFAKIYRLKKQAHHNHEIHFIARNVDEWLGNGIQSIIKRHYDPRCLKRYYFSDEVVEALHPSDSTDLQYQL